MNETIEDDDEEVQWEIVDTGKEVTEETNRFFYDTLKQLKFENDELKGKSQALSTQLNQEKQLLKENKEKLKEIAKKNFVTIQQLEDIETVTKSNVPIKQKFDKNQIDKSKKLLNDGRIIKEEIDQNEKEIQELEKELKKVTLKLDSKKNVFTTNFNNIKIEYEKLKKQYDFFKIHSPELFEEYEEDYYYENDDDESNTNNSNESTEEEDNDQRNAKVIYSSDKKTTSPKNTKEITKSPTKSPKNTTQTEVFISSSANEFPQDKSNQNMQETNRKPKCIDPDINSYILNFSYMPSGIPERSKNGNKLLFPSGEDIIKRKDGTLLIHGTDFAIVRYANGDILQKFKNGATAYQYKETNAVEINLPDATTVTKFANKQIEIRFPNGDVKVQFPDGLIKYYWKDGSEEVIQT